MHKMLSKTLVAAAAALSLGAAHADGSLTWNGVTFNTHVVDSTTLELSILNAVSGGTGNWADIQYISAFELKEIGNVTSASLAGWNTDLTNGLSSNVGCAQGNTPGACFTPMGGPMLLTDSMTFTITFNSGLDFSAPHLKVQFLENATDLQANSDLLSQTIPAVPEPETYALMLAGLGIMGFVARRRRQR